MGATIPPAAQNATDGEPVRHGRYWAVYDRGGELICLTVYRRGALEVLRRLGLANRAPGRQ